MRIRLALITLLVAIGGACASLPPKQAVTTDAQRIETLLGVVQDSATALCVPSPPTHCTASAVVFTDATWHAFNVSLQSAFAAQVQLATALKAWTPGTGTPPTTVSVTTQVQAVIAAVQALPVGSQEQALLAQVQAVLTEIASVAKILGGSL